MGMPDTGAGPAIHRRPAELGWDEARETAYRAASPLSARRLPLREARGRVLAEPLCALVAVPGLDASAMDGYAVSGSAPWTVVARTRAGEEPSAPLRSGTACEIATGAPVPAGTLAVLPYERATRRGDSVDGQVSTGQHIRKAGEQCAEGDTVLPTGSVLGPVALGLAASLGHDELPVRGRPRVLALVTGDELRDAGIPTGAQVRDAIGPMLPGLVSWAGAEFTGLTRLPDSAPRLAEALTEPPADLILVSGSSSRGPADHLRPVLADLRAVVLVDGVRCRPGHPQALARLVTGQLVVGLPGNPFAACAAFLTLAVPALAGLRGLEPPALTPAAGLPPAPGPTRLLPVRVRGGSITPLSHTGSAMLRGLAEADALAVVRPDGSTWLHPLPMQ